jgi:hypothetical protein
MSELVWELTLGKTDQSWYNYKSQYWWVMIWKKTWTPDGEPQKYAARGPIFVLATASYPNSVLQVIDPIATYEHNGMRYDTKDQICSYPDDERMYTSQTYWEIAKTDIWARMKADLPEPPNVAMMFGQNPW